MGTLLKLDELMRQIQRGGDADDQYIMLTVDQPSARRVWAVVFSMALRETATSVHWHPWNASRPLWMTASSAEFAMVPPPQELSEELLSAAREWIAPTACLAGTRAPDCHAGRIIVEQATERFDWFAICWSASGGCGVDLYRCDLVPEPVGAENRSPAV